MKDEVIWGECSGLDISHYFADIDENTDCLVLVLGNGGGQIDCSFRNSKELKIDNWFPRPFGMWKIKK